MKLSPISVPYRALQRATSIGIIAAFVISAGVSHSVGGPLVVIFLAILAILIIFGYETAYYQRFTYEFTVDTLDIHSGVLSRREREIPYRRIQNVDISRNVLERILGIASVSLETAGGSQTEGSIRYVSLPEANRLQETIKRRKQETEPQIDPDHVPQKTELYVISPHELALVGALSFDARILGAVAVVLSGSVPVLSQSIPDPTVFVFTSLGIGFLLILVFASWLLGVVLAVINYFQFRLTQTDDELWYERGLLRRLSGSIPLSKIQTINIEDNPLKRQFGYASMSVETAGYAPGRRGSEQGSQAAIPIARRERIHRLANEIDQYSTESIQFTRPPKRIRFRYLIRYIMLILLLGGVVFVIDWFIAFSLPWMYVGALVLIAPIGAHLKWKHRGYWLGDNHIVTRSGFWNRSAKIVPYYRIQTVIEYQTVFQRRWGVATIVIDTASSRSLLGLGAAAIDIEQRDAESLRQKLPAQLRKAIATRRQPVSSFQWIGENSSNKLA